MTCRAMGVAVLVIALFAAGCGSSRMTPTAPISNADAIAAPGFMPNVAAPPPAKDPALADWGWKSFDRLGFYPLASGNRWHYQRRFSIRVVSPAGAPISEEVFESGVEHVQTCVDSANGGRYLVEREVETGPAGIYTTWTRFRQDGRGLYEADVSIGSPPACEGAAVASPGGAGALEAAAWGRIAARFADPARRAAFERAWREVRARMAMLRGEGPGADVLKRPSRRLPAPPPGELLRLLYPLFPGQRWIIRDEPRFEAMVERADALALAPGRFIAWQIRYDSELFGPHDLVHLWYGRQGFLKHEYRVESVATDVTGSPIGIAIVEDLTTLDAIDVAAPDSFEPAASFK